MKIGVLTLAGVLWLGVVYAASPDASAPRARDLGVPFDGTPGLNNAITDVSGVEVGFTTLISGDGPLVRGKGPVRTGVTAIFPTKLPRKPPNKLCLPTSSIFTSRT